MPWKVFKDGDRFCVHKLTADDKKGEKVACHDTEAQAAAQLRALYANTKEFRGSFHDVMVITELRGSYPNVPIFSDVDYESLIAEDTRAGTIPMFVTLPIAKAGVTSLNKRHYDNEFVTELMKQVSQNKPVGLMGHLSEAERATAFPAEAVHWVGAVRDGDTAWAKGYIPRGSVRDRLERYKAAGRAIATSIDAFAEGAWDEKLGAHRMSASSLRLNQIDIAPADRAGIPDLAAVPHITTEMDSEQETDREQEPTMSKEEVVQELRKANVSPQKGWQPGNAEQVTELAAIREALGVDDKADLPALITEMKQAQAQARKNAITSRITELVTEGVKLESARGIVTELVAARNPQTPEEAQTAYSAVMEMASVKETLEATLQRAMGPSQRVHVAAQKGANKYFNIPKEA